VLHHPLALLMQFVHFFLIHLLLFFFFFFICEKACDRKREENKKEGKLRLNTVSSVTDFIPSVALTLKDKIIRGLQN